MLKRVVGIELIEPGSVDDAKQEVAKLGGRLVLILAPQLALQFIKFLTNLCPDITLVLPVEADVACLVLYAVGLYQRGQR